MTAKCTFGKVLMATDCIIVTFTLDELRIDTGPPRLRSEGSTDPSLLATPPPREFSNISNFRAVYCNKNALLLHVHLYAHNLSTRRVIYHKNYIGNALEWDWLLCRFAT